MKHHTTSESAALEVSPVLPRLRVASTWSARAAGRGGRQVVSFVAIAALLAALWEGYKAYGQANNDMIFGWSLPVATNDLAMPHVSSIVGALFEPTRRGADEVLLVTLLKESVATVKTAVAGLFAGAVAGCVIALLFARVRVMSKGLMPWLVASQTVPLVAIAPMIVIWGAKIGLPGWMAVASIAMYLAFFPVTVNALRGLTSASTLHLELFQSWAAPSNTTMRYLRVPGSLNHVFAGFRLAATAALIGTLVGELSVGTGGGLGRAILNFSYFYSNGPEKLYASVIVASFVGLAFVVVMSLFERVALRNRSGGGAVV